MTEVEWLASTDPQPMLEFLRGKASDRKARLFAVACCRRIENLFQGPSNQALIAAEQYADKLTTETELDAAYWRTLGPAEQAEFDYSGVSDAAAAVHLACSRPPPDEYLAYNADDAPHWASQWAAWAVVRSREVIAQFDEIWPSGHDAGIQELRAHVKLIRCIFGPLAIRPIALDPTWLTSNVTALAQAIYDDRAFDRMPILGNTLEDAGCDNADILNHCRQPGVHVRGCWVVDLVLGKS
jgi:hypothetical protein